jgi:hypothetical protein
MKITTILLLTALLAICLFSTGCEMPTSGDMWGEGNAKGFLYGLLHGFLAPLKFIGSLFLDDMPIYAVSNNGSWYDFGFLLGIGGFSGGIFKSARRRK